MRIDHRQVSPPPRGWGPAADAPTFLPVESRAASQSTIKPNRGAVPPFIPFEGGASFDPLAIPLPPELAPPVYGWLRRLALQADLAGADRLLRDALADLTSSLSVLVIYASPDGLHSVGVNDELPKDMQPVIAVATSRRALVGTHSALIPITTSTETIAVIQLVRNVRQPAFNMIDNVTMAAIARESAAIMHHLVVEHLQRRGEAEADKKSLYRPEALESHRRRGQEGTLTELSPGWVKATYYILVGGLVIGLLCAFFIHVPTYSEGHGVVVFEGTPITAPAPGTVDAIYVQAGTEVHTGTPLVKLKSEKEESDLRQARTELEAATHSYLIDPADETNRKGLVSAQAAAKRAEDAIEQRTVRATTDGTASDIRAHIGSSVNFGDPLLSIVAPGTEPEVWAFLPGSDRPRLRRGQKLQVELLGFQKTRELATITEVDLANTGAAMARTSLGPELADSLKLEQGASYVRVKAKLPNRTFRAKGQLYHYHQGMPATCEVKVENKRFITTLLPSLEKYVE